MYYVPMTPAEVWMMIAVFAVIAIVVTTRKRRAEREWEETMRRKDEEVAEFKEFFAEYKKQHPEIWDENGKPHGSPKAVG